MMMMMVVIMMMIIIILMMMIDDDDVDSEDGSYGDDGDNDGDLDIFVHFRSCPTEW